MLFRGAEMRNKDLGEIKMLEIIDALKEYYRPLKIPSFINRKIIVNLTPVSK